MPIEEVMSNAEDLDTITKRMEESLDEEVALSFLNQNNQGQGAHHRAVHCRVFLSSSGSLVFGKQADLCQVRCSLDNKFLRVNRFTILPEDNLMSS